MEKPKSIKEYCAWLKKRHDQEITPRTRTYYESVAVKIKSGVESGKFWPSLVERLSSINDMYLMKTGYQLLFPDRKPEILIKSFDSLLEKAFRVNVINNTNWDEEPKSGWILPNNWLTRINDLIRTSIIVKYLDGVEFLLTEITNLFSIEREKFHYDYEARMEGYYAVHLYFTDEYEIPRIDWDTEKCKISFEIQITTQLQEVIKNLLHKYYERRRIEFEPTDQKWQWDFRSLEFSTNYLGHILHYVEGMIVDIREKQKGAVT